MRNELTQHWHLVLVCALGIGLGVSSLPFYTQGVFIESWVAEFGWSRTQASLGLLASTVSLALISPFVGSAVDKYGLLKPITFALIGLTLSFALFALLMKSLTTFIVLSATMAILGGASSPLAYTRAINSTFNRQRGLALGLALSGTGLAATFAPRIVNWLIEDYGWRAAYWALSGFVAVMGILILIVLSRLDGIKLSQSKDSKPSVEVFDTAKKSTAYRILLTAVFCLALGIGGLIVHFVPILTELGLSKSSAASTAGIMGVSVIFGRIVIGAIVDRIFAPYVAATFILICILGILSLVVFGVNAAAPAAFVIGFSMGAEVDLIGYLVARYFPMTGYGRIYGRQYAAFLIGTGFSPVLLGFARDKFGSYQPSIILAACILGLAVALFLRLPKFSPEEVS